MKSWSGSERSVFQLLFPLIPIEAKVLSFLIPIPGLKARKSFKFWKMRALKGQLEQDLAEFDYIKSASVILDIPPQKSFG